MNINIEEILKKHESFFNHEEFIARVEAAIKEIVEAVIGKCAEEARIHQIGLYGSANRFEIDNGEITIVADKDSILNVKEMIDYSYNGYTPMQLARQSAVDNNYDIEDDVYKHGFVEGFKAHQELVKDKLFTTEDIRKAIKMAWEADSIDGTVDLNVVLHYGNNNDLRTKWSEEEIIQSLLPKTEWDIEFIDGKIKLL